MFIQVLLFWWHLKSRVNLCKPHHLNATSKPTVDDKTTLFVKKVCRINKTLLTFSWWKYFEPKISANISTDISLVTLHGTCQTENHTRLARLLARIHSVYYTRQLTISCLIEDSNKFASNRWRDLCFCKLSTATGIRKTQKQMIISLSRFSIPWPLLRLPKIN